jgi:Ca2+-binding EF-hand superfamily protein
VNLNVNLAKDGKLTVEAVKESAGPLGKHLTADKDGTAKFVLGTSQLDLRPERADAGAGNIRFARDLDDMVLKMQFSAADADNNGYLDMAEAGRGRGLAGPFRAMDADGDGKLYLKEVLAYVAAQKELRTKAGASCVSLAIRDEGKGLFDLFDKNGDGRLTVREMRDMVQRMIPIDTNKDGAVELSEVPRRYALSPQLGPSNPGGLGDRVIAVSAFGREPRLPPSPQAGPLWFRKMDRNRDGDVSRREVLGTREHFDRIDTDRDGLLSLAEAEKFDEETRKK